MLGKFACFFVYCRLYSKLAFFQKFFQEYHPLESDQDRHFVRLGLGPKCSQRLSAGKELNLFMILTEDDQIDEVRFYF